MGLGRSYFRLIAGGLFGVAWGGLHGPPIYDRQKQTKTEVGTVAECKWTVDWFGKCDDESVARTVAAIAAAVVPNGLELQ